MEHLTGVDRSQMAQLNRSMVSRPDREPLAATDSAEFAASRSCRMALSDTPEVRAEAVARGKALIADPSYPAPGQVKAIASLLARRL